MTVDDSKTKMPLVYVVDDDPCVRASIADVLRHSGCRVTTFPGAADLMTYPVEKPPDVVVTDYVMEPVNGVRVAAWVRSTFPRARIIMVTGDEHLAKSAAGHPLPFAVLEKPLNSMKLIAAIHGVDS